MTPEQQLDQLIRVATGALRSIPEVQVVERDEETDEILITCAGHRVYRLKLERD
jgi:hypothetical protein